jgi:hypothetical protein
MKSDKKDINKKKMTGYFISGKSVNSKCGGGGSSSSSSSSISSSIVVMVVVAIVVW